MGLPHRAILALAVLLPGAAGAQGLPPDATWHLQLNGALKTPDRQVYDIDLFDTPSETIAGLKRQGRTVICYFSAGSYENWRPDASRFPREVRGRKLAGWAGESWLDVRDARVLAIMKARIALARSKGCDGVDPDNVNGHENRTGFPLVERDLLAYNRALAAEAHRLGLLIGLKNTLGLVDELAAEFDFALNESCYTYGECGLLKPFVRLGKPVFIAEYRAYDTGLCARARRDGYNLQFFKLGLKGVGKACPSP